MEKKKISLNDNFKLSTSTRKLTKEGYLKGIAALTKVGVQDYDLSQFTGLDSDSGKRVGVFRPDTTVFHAETISSAKLKPFTSHHPNEMVDSNNHNNYSVGLIGENVQRLDKNRLGATIQINDKDIVKDIMDGSIKEVSLGYSADIIKSIGTHNGSSYSYMFDGPMEINHCAIVDKGRCGETVSILDSQKETKLMSDEKVEVTEGKPLETSKPVNAEVPVVDSEELSTVSCDDSDEHKIIKQADPVEVTDYIKESVKDEHESGMYSFKKAMLADVGFLSMLKDELAKVSEKDVNDSADEKVIEDEASTQVLSDKAEDRQDQQEDIKEQVSVRVKLIDNARKLLKDVDFNEMTNRDILEKSLSKSVKDSSDKSDDYLMGVLDTAIKDHEEAKQYLSDASINSKTSHAPRYYGALDIRKL